NAAARRRLRRRIINTLRKPTTLPTKLSKESKLVSLSKRSIILGNTITEKILMAHANLKEISSGQLINARVDIALGNDVTAPIAINEFQKAGGKKIFDKNKVALILDHFTPNKDINSAQQCKAVREFALKQKVTHFYE